MAVTLDGVGLGDDGTAWGGELLRLERDSFQRLAHLRALPLPGGDRAAREPWRMGASVLHELGRGDEIVQRFRHPGADLLSQVLERRINTPITSSAGRWFDAAAGLLGVRDVSAFEGQAAMLLEGYAAQYGAVSACADGFEITDDGNLDLLPLLAKLIDQRDIGRGAAQFHATFALALAEWIAQHAREQGIERVVLSGGCFMNHLLSNDLVTKLERMELKAYEAGHLPPNDGGISLGQAWVARQVLMRS